MHELRHYLELLLAHECPAAGDCRDCQRLQDIYRRMQTELFETVVFSGAPRDARDKRTPYRGSVTRAAAGPRPPQVR